MIFKTNKIQKVNEFTKKEIDVFNSIETDKTIDDFPELEKFSFETDFMEKFGNLALQADPKDRRRLFRLFWFTIEFGLLKQNGVYKALGSGLNSSPTELIYSVDSPVPERREFNVIDILRTPYRIDIHQPIYYVIDEIDDLLQVAERDLQSDIKKAQSLGLFEKTFNPINETKRTA